MTELIGKSQAGLLLAEIEAEAIWSEALTRNPEKMRRLADEALAEIEAHSTLPFHDLS